MTSDGKICVVAGGSWYKSDRWVVSQGGCFVEDSRAGKSKKGTTKTAGKKQTGSGCQGGRDLKEEIRSDFKTRGEAELEK